MGDKVILSYGDSLLRSRDVGLLQPPNWLNDAIIGFAFEVFANKLPDHLRDAVTFISPEVTQFIKLHRDDDEGDGIPLEIFLEPLGLEKKQFVFLAINDQLDLESPGGSHWSLLIYSRPANSFVHFDSASSNNFNASLVASKATPIPSSTHILLLLLLFFLLLPADGRSRTRCQAVQRLRLRDVRHLSRGIARRLSDDFEDPRGRRRGRVDVRIRGTEEDDDEGEEERVDRED